MNCLHHLLPEKSVNHTKIATRHVYPILLLGLQDTQTRLQTSFCINYNSCVNNNNNNNFISYQGIAVFISISIFTAVTFTWTRIHLIYIYFYLYVDCIYLAVWLQYFNRRNLIRFEVEQLARAHPVKCKPESSTTVGLNFHMMDNNVRAVTVYDLTFSDALVIST